MTEEAEQCAAARYLDLMGFCWCHVPNGGMRNKAEGGKLKAQGTKRGVPDILIFDQPTGFYGLAIELKTDKGRVSPEQKEWLKKLENRGWMVAVCRGAGEVIDLVKETYSLGN